MGFAYLGIGIGGAIVPILAVFLIAELGWQRALQVLGVLIIACAMPLAWFVRDSPEPHQLPEEGRGARAPEPAKLQRTNTRSPSFRPVMARPAFYLLLVASMCSIGAVGGTVQNLKLYLSLDLEYAQDQIATILSLMLVSSLAGRLLAGWLADRWPKKYVMLLIYSIVAMAIPLLFFAESRVALYMFAVAFGIGLGGDYMIIPLMAADLFGVAVLGRVMGIVLTADGAAEALAPMVVAAVRDQTGSYTYGFVLLIVLASIGAAAVALLPKRLTQHRAGDHGVEGTDADAEPGDRGAGGKHAQPGLPRELS